jgi:ApbE superfamily uncharacterized protein (UPF0280 family)
VGSDERGSITLWVLGLCVALLFLGGLGLDLWRAIAVRRELSAMADAAATAAANGLDEQSLRSGSVVLDPTRAGAIAAEMLARDARGARLEAAAVDVDGDQVVVALEDDVPFSLLGIFIDGEPFRVRATATAQPQIRE